MKSALFKAVMFISLALLSNTAIPDRYIDESFREPTGGAGPNIGLGLFLLGGFMFLCFAISDVRTYGYITASVLLLLGFNGATDYFVVGVPILLACIAGTLMEKRVAADSSTDAQLEADKVAANSPFYSAPKKPQSRETIAEQAKSSETKKNVRSVENRPVFREIDQRSNRPSYTDISNQNEAAPKAPKAPGKPNTQPPKPKTHNLRDEPKQPPQALKSAFCSPVTIENPSPAIRGEKLVEDVGLSSLNGDFFAILDKFSWLPHSRTFQIALAMPIEEPVTVTFTRRKSSFSDECTPLGTFLLTGFSSNKAVPNILEIRVSAEDYELYFDARDVAGSRLTITPKS